MTREQESYIIGMAFSDGTLGLKNGKPDYVGIYSSDQDVIEKIALALGVDYHKYLKKGTSKPIFSVRLRGKWLGWFQSRGLIHDKDQLSINKVDVDLYHFLRGSLDGDGSIHSRKISIGESLCELRFLGRERLMKEISLILTKENLKHCYREIICPNKRNLYEVTLSARPGFLLLEKLYGKATIWMDRKKFTYDRLRETYYSEAYQKYLTKFVAD